MSKMQAGMSTAKAARPMQEVMNHAQALSGRRHRLMPRVRISSVVVMKFNAASSWPTQNRDMEVAHRTTPVHSPGPATDPTALSGAYCVKPHRVGPSLTKKDETRTTNATNVTKNEINMNRWKGMTSATN